MELFYKNFEETCSLLNEDLDVNVEDKYGRTPLFYSDLDTTNLLIERGADVNHEDKDGIIPIDLYRELYPGYELKMNSIYGIIREISYDIITGKFHQSTEDGIMEVSDLIRPIELKRIALIRAGSYYDEFYYQDLLPKLREFTSDDVIDVITENSFKQIECCPKAYMYTTVFDEHINEIIRFNKKWTPRTINIVNDMIKSLNKMVELPEDLLVYRGMGWIGWGGRGTIKYTDLRKGDEITLKGFSSFTLDPRIARNFGNYTIEMVLPAGTKVLFLDGSLNTSNYNELEMLTYPNIVIRITEDPERDWTDYIPFSDIYRRKYVQAELIYSGDKNIDQIIKN